jgi:plasmid maintenance system antidote protein VapI
VQYWRPLSGAHPDSYSGERPTSTAAPPVGKLGRLTSGTVPVQAKTVRDYPTHRRSPAGKRPAKPPEALPAGCYVWEELEARGWSRSTLAAVSGISLGELTAILAGGVLTTSAAAKLAKAFGTKPPCLWLEIERQYRESQLRRPF